MNKHYSISSNNEFMGIGVDIESISRFQERPFWKNKGFYQKIFTKDEIDYCLKKANPYQHFAARFCAKEAFVKAINEKVVDYKSIEVVMLKDKPTIKWKGQNVLLSLAHDRDKAIAYVVIAKDKESDSKLRLLPPNINKIIEGRNVVLKPFTPKEVNQKYISWLNDPKVNQFLEVRHKKQTILSVVDYINGLRSKSNCEIFAVFTKVNNDYIGTVTIASYDKYNKVAVHGQLIGEPSARETGLGGEATLLIVEYLFCHAGARKVWGKAIAGNQKSWRNAETLGFKREGILREHSLFKSGKTDDQYAYGMLYKEWLVQRKKLMSILKDVKVKDITT